MAHDNHDSHELPIIPFTATEQAVMEADDGKAAKIIASLTTGIFLVGIVLYVTVMVSVLARDPIYSIR